MTTAKILPSILSADFRCLGQQIELPPTADGFFHDHKVNPHLF